MLLCPYALAGEITVFFTGNELGQLQPCGCSGGQLGGLDRRYAVFNTVKLENRLIFDTGSLVVDPSEQNLIKFNVIVQAYSQLGYDLVNLTARDISIAQQAGLLDGLCSVSGCITASAADDVKLPEKFKKRFSLNGVPVDVTVVAADTQDQISRLPEILTQSSESAPVVNILISNLSDAETIAAVSQMKLVDCMIVASHSDEPMLLGDPNSRPLVIAAGRIGKYVGKIQIALQNPSGMPQVSFSSIPVTEDLPQNQALVELYKDYQKMLKDANLLEKFPRFVLPDNLEYVGSKYCKLCHDYEYEKWMNSPQVFIPGLVKQADATSRHSNAWQTLVDVNSEYDPECVVCHVIGMQYQTGFVSPAKTPEMKDVGCENCHGPGSEHIRSLGAVETSGPMSTCTDCHTIEHSVNYENNQKLYFEKTIHWRQPLSRVRVSEPNH
jgi:hypothetical protein